MRSINAKRKAGTRRHVLSDAQGATKTKPQPSHRRTSSRHKRAFRGARGA